MTGAEFKRTVISIIKDPQYKLPNHARHLISSSLVNAIYNVVMQEYKDLI